MTRYAAVEDIEFKQLERDFHDLLPGKTVSDVLLRKCIQSRTIALQFAVAHTTEIWNNDILAL